MQDAYAYDPESIAEKHVLCSETHTLPADTFADWYAIADCPSVMTMLLNMQALAATGITVRVVSHVVVPSPIKVPVYVVVRYGVTAIEPASEVAPSISIETCLALIELQASIDD